MRQTAVNAGVLRLQGAQGQVRPAARECGEEVLEERGKGGGALRGSSDIY
jgi:hypothetical protein